MPNMHKEHAKGRFINVHICAERVVLQFSSQEKKYISSEKDFLRF